jgi:DNA repair exonuclease SbcCD ATPase subunit
MTEASQKLHALAPEVARASQGMADVAKRGGAAADTMRYSAQATEGAVKASERYSNVTGAMSFQGGVLADTMMNLTRTSTQAQQQGRENADKELALRKQVEELQTSKSVSEKEEQELKVISGVLETLKQDLKDFIDEKTYYEVAGNLLKDSGIKTKIVKQYLPVINKLVNKYLAALDFFVNFNLDESFKETIKSRHRDEFTYNNFSEGEKQRIDMALMMTWRAVAKLKNSSNTNLLILDETFDSSLDASGTEYLMNILNMLEDVNIFVISHKGDILQDKFNNVIRFVKEKNFSKVMK